MAGSAPIELQTQQIDLALAQSQVSESIDDTEALAMRRTEVTDQSALLQGRQQEADRVAREQERLALAKKKEEEARQQAEDEARKSAQKWVLPMDSYNFTSSFGHRWGRLHAGIDLAAPSGTPIFSVSSGTVVRLSSAGGCGKQVWIQHWEGTVTRYCHLDYFSVGDGERVGAGQKIGGTGNTGRSFGAHLHFEVHPNGIDGGPTNPIQWLQGKGLGV